MSNRWVKPWRAVLAALWPQACFVCAGRTRVGVLCGACAVDLPWPGEACPVCANPSPAGQRCGRCLRRAPPFEATRAVFEYRYPVREMVLALKNGHGFVLADYLAEQALPRLAGLAPDVMIAMPLHANRLAERGFNPVMEFARALSRQTGWPLDWQHVLRDIDTPHQAGARLSERLRNVRGAFRCTQSFAGQHVLLLDDVMTSGATLGELARTLKLAGAARVSCLVMTRAVMSSHGR